MAGKYKKTAVRKEERKRRRHHGVPQLAAEIAGVSIWMVYKVIYRQSTSARVQKAITEAKERLGLERAA